MEIADGSIVLVGTFIFLVSFSEKTRYHSRGHPSSKEFFKMSERHLQELDANEHSWFSRPAKNQILYRTFNFGVSLTIAILVQKSTFFIFVERGFFKKNLRVKNAKISDLGDNVSSPKSFQNSLQFLSLFRHCTSSHYIVMKKMPIWG